jgi:hypothetical protein
MIGYYTSRISDNIGETPEGFLVCRDAVIGRTGFQTYKGAEMIREHGEDGLKKLGLDNVSPNDDIKVFRDPTEVFHPDTLQSFEGKAFTDNHPPGNQFVTPENIDLYQRGHIQNVRKGAEPLDSGDWPMLADIVITHSDLISKVKNGERELSSGYNYALAHRNGKIFQTDIVGNHAALVPKGRAGHDARINDAAPAVVAVQPQLIPTKKEKPHVSNRLMDLLGRGLKALATDEATTPEALAEAAGEISKANKPATSVSRARAQDAESTEEENDKPKPKSEDAAASDHGKRMHAALDRILSAHAETEQAKDADLEELKGLMGKHFKEGEETSSVADIAPTDVTDPSTCSPGIGNDAETEEEKDEKERHGEDAAPLVELFAAPDKATRHIARAADAAAFDAVFEEGKTDGAAFVLNAIKPHIAKAIQLAGKGSAAAKHLARAFDTIATSVNASVKHDGAGSYADFAAGATGRSEEARQSVEEGKRHLARAADGSPAKTGAERADELNNMFKARHRVPTNSEVK